MIRMDYQVHLQYEAQGPGDFLLNVCPARTCQQRVLNEDVSVQGARQLPGHTDPVTANRISRLHTDGGNVQFHYRGLVEMQHVLADPAALREQPIHALPGEVVSYLLPSRFCPSDRMRAIATAMFGNVAPGHARVEAICAWVMQHVRFDPGASNAMTCAMETFDARAGVCRDYAHLMIAMCRALNLPARYVTGVDFGAPVAMGPPDFHAYVEVFLGDRWYLFDATGLTPVEGLIRIGTGRDAADVSFGTVFGAVWCARPLVAIELLSCSAAELEPAGSMRRACSTAQPALTAAPMPAPLVATVPPELVASGAWLVRARPNPFRSPQLS